MEFTPLPTCPVCGTPLVLSSCWYACCPVNLEHAKLIRLTHSQRYVLNTMSRPVAKYVGDNHYEVDGVRHTRIPMAWFADDDFVARVEMKGRWRRIHLAPLEKTP